MRRWLVGLSLLLAAAVSIGLLARVTTWEQASLELTDFITASGSLLLVVVTALYVVLTSRLVHSQHEAFVRPIKVSRTFGWQLDLRNYGPGIVTDVRVAAWSSPFGKGRSTLDRLSLWETAVGPYEIPPGHEGPFELNPFLDFSSSSKHDLDSGLIKVSWRLLSEKRVSAYWLLVREPEATLRMPSFGQRWGLAKLLLARRVRSLVYHSNWRQTIHATHSETRNVFLGPEGRPSEAALALLMALGAYGEDSLDTWDKPLSRAEFLGDLVTAQGRSATAQGLRGLRPQLPDEIPEWAWGFVNVGLYAGIVKGYEDGSFRPNSAVTYAEAITMSVRSVAGHNRSLPPGLWPYNYLFYGVDRGFSGGVDVGSANLPAKRGDAARMIVATLRANKVDEGGSTVEGTSVLAHRVFRGRLQRVLPCSAITVEPFTLPLAPKVLVVGSQPLRSLVGSPVEVLVDSQSRVCYVHGVRA